MADDILKEAREAFDLCQEVESDNRVAALDDLRFARLGEQWPEEVRRQRDLDGRPCLTINRMPAIIRQVTNDARQNKPSIRVRPVDDKADPQTAEIINGLIRNIEYTSNADVAYDTASDFAVTMGFGYFRIGIEYACDDSFDRDLLIQAIANPFSVYGDPHSTAADSADWNTAFVTDWIKKSEFERRFKGAKPVDWTAEGYGDLADQWITDDSVLVAEWWKREEVERKIVLLSDRTIVDAGRYQQYKDAFDAAGIVVVGERTTKSHKVTQRLMTGAEVIEETPWAGRYIPIIPVYGEEVNVEGKRHFRSLIRDAKDSQRMLNYWRTTSTELVALAPKAPYIGPKGAFTTDADKWATANTQNWSYIEFDGQIAPQRQPFEGVPAGALQEALNASDDIKAITGIFDAALGAQGNETSGRAIVARQREGDTSTFHFIDNLSRAIRHAGRVLLDLIPAVYTEQRVVRVLGEDGQPKNAMVGQQAQGPDGQPVPPPPGFDRIYDLTLGKYDLVVSAGPSYTTKREEAANQMLELVRAFPQAAPMVGDLLAKNLDWPGADEIAQRMQALQQQMTQAQDPNAAAQKAQAEAQAKAQGEMAKLQMEAQIEQAKLQQQGQLQREKMQQDMALRREQLQAELQLQREQAEAELALKAQMGAATAAASFATSPIQPGGQPG